MSSPARSGRVRVAVLGGGIAGLTAAHQLSARAPGAYDIHVYERLDALGGMARSMRAAPARCAEEYSWRIVFYFYRNLLQLMQEIPCTNRRTGAPETVRDRLVPGGTQLFPLHDASNASSGAGVQWWRDPGAYLPLAKRVWRFSSSCTARAREEYGDAPFLPDWDPNAAGGGGSSGSEPVWATVPQTYGLDKQYASAYSVLRVGVEDLFLSGRGRTNYAFDQPTSEAWFDPWRRLLERRGVRFHLQQRALALAVSPAGDAIAGVQLQDLGGSRNDPEGGCVYWERADRYVLALPVQELARLVDAAPRALKRRNPPLRDLGALARRGAILQLCFQVHFDRPLFLSRDRAVNGFTLVGSPWALIVQTREALYGRERVPLCACDARVRGSWSVLCGQDRVPGVLYGKPFSQCSETEIHAELWAQMAQNEGLVRAVREVNGCAFAPERVVRWSPMWPTFGYDARTGRLGTSEIKFSNNVGTLALRPPCRLALRNAALAGAYTREATDIFCMEGACLSGRLAAARILEMDAPARPGLARAAAETRPLAPIARPWPFAPLRGLDALAHALGLPNLSVLWTLLAVVLVAWALRAVFIAWTTQRRKPPRPNPGRASSEPAARPPTNGSTALPGPGAYDTVSYPYPYGAG